MAQIRLGTCSWTAKGWAGTIYPPGTAQTDFISVYAEQYSTVEIDATFYAIPRESTVEGWRDRTPDGFLFAAKAPKAITHEKLMEDATGDITEFLRVMDILGDKLGPVIFQFPYFTRRSRVTQFLFLRRLGLFLNELPRDGHQFGVEVRNKSWLDQQLLDLLREHGITLVFIAHPWMPGPKQLARMEGALTGPFAYIRWLGDRQAIGEEDHSWTHVIIDRRQELADWADLIRGVLDRGLDVYGYANNHYSGFAPADVATLREMLSEVA